MTEVTQFEARRVTTPFNNVDHIEINVKTRTSCGDFSTTGMKHASLWLLVALHKICLYFATNRCSLRPDDGIRGVGMKSKILVALVAATVCSGLAKAEEYKLPPEVTPALRAACESDVRRLCIGLNPTVAKVKSCVAVKFMQLGKRCQIQLALAGFKR